MTHHLFTLSKTHTNQDQLALVFCWCLFGFFVFFMGKLEQEGQYQILWHVSPGQIFLLLLELLLILCSAILHPHKSRVLKSIPSSFCLSIKNLLLPFWIQGLIPSFSWHLFSWVAAGFLHCHLPPWHLQYPHLGEPYPQHTPSAVQKLLWSDFMDQLTGQRPQHTAKSHFRLKSAGVMQ